MRPNFVLVLSLVTIAVDSFQIQRRQQQKSSTIRLFSETYLLSLDKTAVREVDQFQQWAAQYGVQPETGFSLRGDVVFGIEDWYAVTNTGGAQGSRVLYVPASRIAQEYAGYVDSCLGILEEKEMLHLAPEFYLFLKILLEYEKGVDSPYYPWLASLPRTWNTAASFDYFCMSTLPPYIKKVCQMERNKLKAFQNALRDFSYLSPEARANDELMKFAYNVVTTRSWPDTSSVGQDCVIALGADFFNHGYPGNVALSYNQQSGECEVFLTRDVNPGEPLTFCYASPTNPSFLLAKYGFLNEENPTTYCKILYTNPSQKLIDIGYDPERMVIYTADGSVSQEVWDVLLYSKLERAPGMAEPKNAFYQAHMSGDEATKMAIHAQFQRATCEALLSHIDDILKEVSQLTKMMIKFQNDEKHPRLPLLYRHHEMVSSTFSRARDYTINILNNS